MLSFLKKAPTSKFSLTVNSEKTFLFCGTKEWNLDVKATCGGSSSLTFNYDSIPGNILIEIFYDDSSLVITDGSMIEFTLSPNIAKDFLIKVSAN